MEEIKKSLLPFLEEKGYTLYSIQFVKEYGMKILQIIVDKVGGITVDELAIVNEFISERISDNVSETEYILEVSSRGAERELEKDEWNSSLDQYVMVKTDKENYGYLREINNDFLVLEVNEKGQIRKRQIEISKIIKIRLSVKF